MLHAEVSLPGIFEDRMVLQRDTPLPIWGEAQPGELVTIWFKEAKITGRAGTDGRWELTLPPQKASAAPETLTIRGKNTVVFHDVLVGDVWLFAGQSNMQFPLQSLRESKEFSTVAEEPNFRMFTVPHNWHRREQPRLGGSWQRSTAQAAKIFSAIAYLVGRELACKTKIPQGIIVVAFGGCNVESMCRADSFRKAKLPREITSSQENAIALWHAMPDQEIQKSPQLLPSALYNAMVHPLGPLAVKGMVWYQGETNLEEGLIYLEKLRALALSWRDCFRQKDLPIYLIQIPPYRYEKNHPDQLPILWLAQSFFSRLDQRTALFSTSDCGDPNDLHPREKRALAKRLVNLLLYKSYGIGDSSALTPEALSARRDGNNVVVTFRNAERFKTRDGNPVSHLELAGEDYLFHPAGASIVGNTLCVFSSSVPNPKFVRFGWHNLAIPNLVNPANVPVYPFWLPVF
ncbi:MAG: sialate O-acetylesterase [Victivallaceae bacterium]|nr:sialate O-acetylesterase [Victivallaceae bacterium]